MTKEVPKFKVCDLDYSETTRNKPMYVSDFHICRIINDWTYDLQDPSGHIHCASVADIQLLLPV